MGNVAGTFRISELIEYRDVILEHPQYPLILGLLFLGAFTKSAQFPFHFGYPEQ
jgi:multicomponent Na+:H+ antiporter subunit A